MKGASSSGSAKSRNDQNKPFYWIIVVNKNSWLLFFSFHWSKLKNKQKLQCIYLLKNSPLISPSYIYFALNRFKLIVYFFFSMGTPLSNCRCTWHKDIVWGPEPERRVSWLTAPRGNQQVVPPDTCRPVPTCKWWNNFKRASGAPRPSPFCTFLASKSLIHLLIYDALIRRTENWFFLFNYSYY